MKITKYKSITFIILLTAGAFIAINSMIIPASAQTGMSAWYTDNIMTLDGSDAEEDWATADTLILTNYGEGARTDANITLKFLNDGTNIYMYAEWDDATENSNRKGWEWNPSTSTYDNLGGNEDRLGISWASTDTGMVCGHSSYSGAPSGMLFDTWHWKATRGSAGWADDKYWEADGRHSDAKTSGGYSENSVVNKAVDATEITTKLGNTTTISIYGAGDLPYQYDDGTEIPWVGGTATGTMPTDVRGYIESIPVGSRGDVKASAVYVNGKWHLELMRALSTGETDDLAFVIGQSYDFYIGQMDNSGGTHAAEATSKYTLTISDLANPETVSITTTVTETETETGDIVTKTGDTVTETVTTTEAGFTFIFAFTILTSSLFVLVYYRKIKR